MLYATDLTPVAQKAFPICATPNGSGEDNQTRSEQPSLMEVLRTLGAPYTDEEIQNAPAELEGKTEMDAMIAYLQRLGTVIKNRR